MKHKLLVVILLILTGPAVRSMSKFAMMGKKAPWKVNQAPAKKIYLEEYMNSIDDEFQGCKEKMYRRVVSKLLRRELNSNGKFRQAWREAKANLGLTSVKDSKLKKNDLRRLALRAYTGNQVYGQLNNKMRSGRHDYMTQKFGLISLHFLITDAIQVLNPHGACETTYRFSKDKFVIPGKFVRFGGFASTTRKSTLSNFGKTTCFIIVTCHGAHISKVSKYANEDEVLVPPYERFRQYPSTKIPKSLADCGHVYTLRSVGKMSNMKCELFKHKKHPG